MLYKSYKLAGESGESPELFRNCIGSSLMAVPSQGHGRSGNQVRAPENNVRAQAIENVAAGSWDGRVHPDFVRLFYVFP